MSPQPPRTLCLADEFKQDMVIACLQHSPNHKSPSKKNGKAIRWEDVTGLVRVREFVRVAGRKNEGKRDERRANNTARTSSTESAAFPPGDDEGSTRDIVLVSIKSLIRKALNKIEVSEITELI